jgi:uncharacterized protein (TIGR03067 family)
VKRIAISVAMMLFSIACLATAADAPAAAPDPALAGDWIVESAEYHSEKNPDPVGDKFSFSADKVTVTRKQGNKTDSASYSVDAKASPKEIDLTPLDENGKEMGKTMLGIYVLEGQTLRICVNDRGGGQRPTKFDAGAGTNTVLLTLRKAK